MEHLLAKEGVAGSIPVSRFFIAKGYLHRRYPFCNREAELLEPAYCISGFVSRLPAHNVETKKMSPAKSPNISGFFATQTAIFLCTKTQM